MTNDPKREAVARNDDLIAVPREVLAAVNYIIQGSVHAGSNTAARMREYALAFPMRALGSANGEEFLAQLRRVNAERYAAWAVEPLMLCEHCGRFQEEAIQAGSEACIPPFTVQDHDFTKPHPYLTRSNDAGIMFDALELGGEVGELLNIVKKLEREDRGWRGSRANPADFADECADVLICLDKLARRRNVDLIAATVSKFNATSEKVGLPQKLTARGEGAA